MDKQDLFPACPVETTLKLIGDKWSVLILRDLFLGARRFSELKRSSQAFRRRCSRRSCAAWRRQVW